MSTRTFTFDPDAGVPVGADLTIHTGSTFKANFNVQDVNSSTYDLTDWSGSSQMQKGVGIGATTVPAGTFTVGFTSAYDGKFYIEMDASSTRNLSEGRYEYNILMTGGEETITLFDTAISAGSTAGIGTTVFTVNKRTDSASGYTVAIGDSFTVGAALTDVAIVGVGTTVNEITIGTAHTSPLQIEPGTGVTFTRTGSATTIYSMVNGNILVIAGISSAP